MKCILVSVCLVLLTTSFASASTQLCPGDTSSSWCNSTHVLTSGNNYFYFDDHSDCGRNVYVISLADRDFSIYVSLTTSTPNSMSSFSSYDLANCIYQTCENGVGTCCKADVSSNTLSFGSSSSSSTYYINVDVDPGEAIGTYKIALEKDDDCDVGAAAVGAIFLIIFLACCLPCIVIGIIVGICYCTGAMCFAAASKGSGSAGRRGKNPALEANNGGTGTVAMTSAVPNYPGGQAAATSAPTAAAYPYPQQPAYAAAGGAAAQPQYTAYNPQQQGAYGQAQPTYPQAQPAYPQAQPAYPQAQPAYAQGQPAYAQGQPAYAQGQPAYAQQPYPQAQVPYPQAQQLPPASSKVGGTTI